MQGTESSLADLSPADNTAPPLSGKATHSATRVAVAQQQSQASQAAVSAKQGLHDASDTARTVASKQELPGSQATTVASSDSAVDTGLKLGYGWKSRVWL